MRGIWQTLGIERTRDRTTIRRAYATVLKKTNPEDDPEGFKRLREAYDSALTYADQGYEPYSHDYGAVDADAYDEDDDDDEDYAAGDDEAAWDDGAPDDAAARDRDGLRDERRRQRAEAQPEGDFIIDMGDASADEEPVSYRRRDGGGERARPSSRIAADPEAVASFRAFETLRARLANVVQRGDAAPEQMQDTLRELLQSEALIELGTYAQTETWLADLIVYNFPRSDPLVGPAIERFDWHGRGRTLGVTPAIQGVLSREDDLRYLRQLKARAHPQNPPFRALTQKAGGRSPWRRLQAVWMAGDVRRLLEQIEYERPTLRNDLDQTAVDWWRAYFSKPHLDPVFLTVALGAPVFFALAGLAMDVSGPQRLINGFNGFIYSAIPLLALVVVKHFAFDVPRHRWRREWSWRTPDWAMTGWAGLGAVALGMGVLLPAHPASTGLLAFLSIAVLSWAFTVADEDNAASDWVLRIGRVIWANLLFAVCWGVMIAGQSPGHILQITLPALALVIGFERAPRRLFGLWDGALPRTGRIAAMTGLGGIALACAAWIFAGIGAGRMGLTTVALVALVVLLQRVPAMLHSEGAIKIRYYGVLALTILGSLLMPAYNLSPGATAGLILLLGALVSLGLSIHAELTRR